MRDDTEVWWLKPAVVGAVFLILAVLTCAAVVTHNDKMLDSINSLTGNAVMLVLGYYFGSSSGSAKKDAVISASVRAPVMPPVPPVAPLPPASAPVAATPAPPVSPADSAPVAAAPMAPEPAIAPTLSPYQNGRTARLSNAMRSAPADLPAPDAAEWLRGYDEVQT